MFPVATYGHDEFARNVLGCHLRMRTIEWTRERGRRQLSIVLALILHSTHSGYSFSSSVIFGVAIVLF